MQVERRGGDVKQDPTSGGDQVLDRIDTVQATVPKVLVVPGILADRKREWCPVEGDYGLLVSRSEVADFVENVVGRQEPLALDGCDFPIGKQSRGIQDRLAGSRLRRCDQAADDGYTQRA